MVAADSSPSMIALAASAEPALAAVVSDAARLPFTDASFDLVVAFMCLHDMDQMAGAIGEAGRVLAPGGRLAFAVVHPINSAGDFAGKEPDAPFVITGSYLDDHPADWTADSGGIRVDFHSEHHSLEAYAAAVASAGLLIEQIREPKATPELLAIIPAAARFQRLPVVLHMLALRPAS